MIRRFSLYGFLKNQRYFEPFIILFFLQQGLSFTQIGFLIGFRELCVNILEIPSGALADLYGRRRCMVFSFVAYVASFTVFGLSQTYWHLFPAMLLFATGEAFRTGTHKAMIFTWLRLHGRESEKTKIYGYTRSWSKLGSALSTVLATVFVLLTNNYSYVFYYSIIPYALGLINLMTYPKELDGQPADSVSLQDIITHLRETIRDAVRLPRLRRLVVESMAFEGMFKAAADYLQPVLKSLALALPVLVALGDIQRTAIVVGVVYSLLYLASAYGSRRSHDIAGYLGGEESGSRLLWRVVLVAYVAMTPLLFFEYYYAAVVGFMLLYVAQNIWRPILIGRFETFATETHGATVLSIESQAKSLTTMIVAPLLGLAVDSVSASGAGGSFWPVTAVAAIVALLVLGGYRQRKHQAGQR